MSHVIYFDLDGTLWDSGHPLLQTAWERLPESWRKVCGDLPNGFDWKSLAGSTDYTVVRELVERTQFDSDPEVKKQIVVSVLAEMDDYYVSNAPDDIKAALYEDTATGLKRLVSEGWKLGIVTGNTLVVTEHKLHAAGLYDLFSFGKTEGLWFCGDQAESRSKMLFEAWEKQCFIANREGKDRIPPLIYVADTYRDLMEFLESEREHGFRYSHGEYRILLRIGSAVYDHLTDIQQYSNAGYSFKDSRVQLFGQIGDQLFDLITDSEGKYSWFREREYPYL